MSGWVIVLAGIAALLLTSCSSPPPPPVAEFSVSKNAGNAPLDVSFVLGELADGDSFSWDFGDGTGSEEAEPAHTFQDVGTFTIRLNATRGEKESYSEATVTVESGQAGWIVIEGGPSSGSMASLETARFTARAFDALGNAVVDPVFNWQADSIAGGIDDSGVFTAGTELGNFNDAITVEFERLGTTAKQVVGVEITNGPLHAISIEPNVLDIGVGRTQTITVIAVDEAGHVLDSVLTLFTALRNEDSVDSAGVFTVGTTATDAPVKLVSVEVEQHGQVIEATVSGTVEPGILDQVHVSNLSDSVSAGESVQIEASATDRFGNKLELDQLLWAVSDPGIGTVTETGLFTAGTVAGTYIDEGLTVRGVLERVESVTVVPVTITPGSAVSIRIVPDGVSVPIGAGSPFDIQASDVNGNLLDLEYDLYEYEYSYAGRGNEVAVFIAGYELGDFENAITVTLPAGVAGNDSDLVVQSDVTIRQRSSNIVAVEAVDQDGGGILFIDLETAELGPANVDFTENGAVELSPTWWPDGSRLVYVSNSGETLQVFTLELETKEIVQLTDVAEGVSMPGISPDGKFIVFAHMDNDNWQLFVAPIPDDVATNPITLADTTQVSIDESAQYVLPFWSPDGTQILVTENGADGRVHMMLFDPTLVNEPRVIGPNGTVGFGWTLDSGSVHFGLSTEDGALDLGTLDLATGIARFIETPLEFLIAAWAPDDSELMAVDSLIGAAWMLDSDGTGSRRVVDPDTFPTRMSWRPKAYGDPIDVPELDGPPVMLIAGDEPAPPVGALDRSLSYSAVITTDSGTVEVELFDDLAPMTVENFINLARIGYYDGLEFHRVVPGFVSQAGDPAGTGNGGPGYMFNDEFSRELSHDSVGVLSMANTGSNTNGGQFFITHKPAVFLDAFEDDLMKNCADNSVSCHSVFGRVTDGIEIVTAMVERDPAVASEAGVKILSIEIIEN